MTLLKNPHYCRTQRAFPWAAAAIGLACCLLAASCGTTQAADAERYDGKSATEWLPLLKDSDNLVRRRACYALGEIRPVLPETVSGIAEVLANKDEETEARWYAAEALAKFGPESQRAVGTIVQTLESTAAYEDKDYVRDLRRIMARALGQIGASAIDGVAILEKAPNSTDPLYRVAASLALFKITQKIPLIRPIMDAIKSENPAEVYAGLSALREVGPPALPGAKAVVTCLSHPDRDVRRAAVKTLAAWGLAATPSIVDALAQKEESTLIGAATAAALVIDDSRRSLLDGAQVDAARRDEASAAIVGGMLPALARLMTDPRPAVAAAARRAVALIGMPALPALVAALQSPTAPEREAAAAALRELEDYLPPPNRMPPHFASLRESLVTALIAALKSPERTTRIAALRLFAALAIGPEGIAALPQLQAALKDEDVAVRSDAAQALDRVQKSVP